MRECLLPGQLSTLRDLFEWPPFSQCPRAAPHGRRLGLSLCHLRERHRALPSSSGSRPAEAIFFQCFLRCTKGQRVNFHDRDPVVERRELGRIALGSSATGVWSLSSMQAEL